jgi:hypothetical protein
VEAVGRPRIDASVAHSARVHDYWLGGKDNFAAEAGKTRAEAEAQSGMWSGVGRRA